MLIFLFHILIMLLFQNSSAYFQVLFCLIFLLSLQRSCPGFGLQPISDRVVNALLSLPVAHILDVKLFASVISLCSGVFLHACVFVNHSSLKGLFLIHCFCIFYGYTFHYLHIFMFLPSSLFWICSCLFTYCHWPVDKKGEQWVHTKERMTEWEKDRQ